MPDFSLTSPAFQPGGSLPAEFTVERAATAPGAALAKATLTATYRRGGR